MDENKGEILIYQSEDGLTNVEVTVQDETVWLSQQQMAELFQTSIYNLFEFIVLCQETPLNQFITGTCYFFNNRIT